ncbi:hypothetical protein A3B18_02070 [Candidatus Giovannonibacteria bacterium RIFCSPLOWO2_01_FULL_46_13]|uniref:Nudix hydrolase domain-containing protein n=1 Tax=Candidatus Giovannonibacteria bacterium RIFCSPLOWO2_01_FULL_46_13 TaxID=1798352 RepID=A0A1F5X653_9BACT|nr:MAG: hypothetical protein A3B18_02070 [Candidatus Giovannonibacteria bacterium RIFCSPLOWO2_01_FULL_46_13]
MSERNKAVPASYLILEKEGKVLLGQRINTGYCDGYYDLPAGHVEAEELPLRALIREAMEEIGIEILPEDVQFVHVIYRPKHDETGERVDFFFKALKYSGEPSIKEPNKCGDLQWFPYDDLPEKVTPHVRDVLGRYRKGINYSELSSNNN